MTVAVQTAKPTITQPLINLGLVPLDQQLLPLSLCQDDELGKTCVGICNDTLQQSLEMAHQSVYCASMKQISVVLQ